MIRIDTTDARKVADQMRIAFRFKRFWQAVDIKDEQEDLFMRRGVDGGRQLKESTILARQRGWGYYRLSKRSGVSSFRPYGVWTGNTLEHTHKAKGRLSFRSNEMRISHNLERRITNYWEVKGLERALLPKLERWVQAAFDGKLGARAIA